MTLSNATPEHSTLSCNRAQIPVETHEEVFSFALGMLAMSGPLSGKKLGNDATTLEVSTALGSMVRRDTGEAYSDSLERLAKECGIERRRAKILRRLIATAMD